MRGPGEDEPLACGCGKWAAPAGGCERGLRAGSRSFGANLRPQSPPRWEARARSARAMTFPYSINRFGPALWFGALLLLIVLVEHAVTTLPAFQLRPALPLGVTLDLLVVMPGLFYALVVRRYRLPAASVVGACGAGLALGYWMIPAGQQQYLRLADPALGLLEALSAAWAVANLRRIARAYRAARQQGANFMDNLAGAFQQVLGRSLSPLVFEISVFRYALLGWWAAPEARAADVAFSSHRESGFPALAVMGSVALVVETAAVHLLASHWSPALALGLLVVDGYGLLVWTAHGHAVRLRPTLLTADEVIIRVGFFWKLAVPRAGLVAAEPLREVPAAGADVLNLAKLLFTTPNLLLTFAEPVEAAGPYGIRRPARRVAIYLDHPQRFRQAINEHKSRGAEE